MEPPKRTTYTTRSGVVDRRTLATDFRALAALLRPGTRVLDGGCATGPITTGIAQAVSPTGYALGVDTNADFVARAAQAPNLEYEVRSLDNLAGLDPFDLVNTARTLQWVRNPAECLASMISVTRPGGLVVVLDYNHTRIEWQPEVPATMRQFTDAWLQWRTNEGLDSEIADHLAAMFRAAGLVNVRVEPQHEPVHKGEPAWEATTGIWASMVAVHATELGPSGLMTADECGIAERDYRAWIAGPGQFQQMYLLACIGQKPS